MYISLQISPLENSLRQCYGDSKEDEKNEKKAEAEQQQFISWKLCVISEFVPREGEESFWCMYIISQQFTCILSRLKCLHLNNGTEVECVYSSKNLMRVLSRTNLWTFWRSTSSFHFYAQSLILVLYISYQIKDVFNCFITLSSITVRINFHEMKNPSNSSALNRQEIVCNYWKLLL